MNPLGVKGAGEAGTVGALAAVINAIVGCAVAVRSRSHRDAGNAGADMAHDPGRESRARMRRHALCRRSAPLACQRVCDRSGFGDGRRAERAAGQLSRRHSGLSEDLSERPDRRPRCLYCRAGAAHRRQHGGSCNITQTLSGLPALQREELRSAATKAAATAWWRFSPAGSIPWRRRAPSNARMRPGCRFRNWRS